jgi:hypothetical protein
MTPYYFVYAIVLCGVPICFVNDASLRRQMQWIYFAFTVPLLILFAGMRAPFVDADYYNYVLWFNDIRRGDADLSEWFRDPLFSLISTFISFVGGSYLVVTLIFAVISLPLKLYLASKFVDNRWLTLFFYLLFCHFYLLLDMTEIRAAVAIPLMALSLYWACESKRRRALLTFLLAAIFHFSVILALPVLMLLLIGIKLRSRWWVIVLAPLACAASLTFKGALDALGNVYRLSEYVDPDEAQGTLTLKSPFFAVLLLVVLIGVFVVWQRLSLHYRVAVFCSGLGLFFFVIFLSSKPLADRCKDLFEIYSLLLFVVFMQLLQGSKRYVYAAALIVMGFVLIYKEFVTINPYTFSDVSGAISNASFIGSS